MFKRCSQDILHFVQESSRLPGSLLDISTFCLSRRRTVACEVQCDVSIAIIVTLIFLYHVIITYFRTEFSQGDLKDPRQNTGEIIFVNISILRCICSCQSFFLMYREKYTHKAVISRTCIVMSIRLFGLSTTEFIICSFHQILLG